MQITYSIHNIQQAVAEFWSIAQSYKVITLQGDLGAGKTTFTSALCTYLGVVEQVSSPTFAIINQYHYTNELQERITIYHSDWYRIKDETEAIDAGIEDMMMQPNSICIIEWASHAPGLLPLHYLNVDIKFINETERTLVLEKR
jgi:tRNA threonylcarbamoyladenosine biosynthesis protein TsaE